ncbi:MAG TPA: hypothetical protein VLT35_05600 [Methanocella sp.]|nr:hypothetical protein [Methanocella sp.]
MITAQHIKDRLAVEKDPIRYVDDEVSRHINEMGDWCKMIQDAISTYNNREDKNEQFDLPRIKEEMIKMGELYYEIGLYLKARKELIKNQKRSEQVNKAQARHQKWVEQLNDGKK